MTNPKTDHKSRKPIPSAHPSGHAAVAAQEKPTNAATPMIEACDRLGQKLDEVAGLFREQIEAWRQIRPPTETQPATPENAVQRPVDARPIKRIVSVEERRSETRAENGERPQEDKVAPPPAPSIGAPPLSPAPPHIPESEQRRDAAATLPQMDAPRDDGLAATVKDAKHLVDTLARPAQTDGMQQALENIITYLENQAATAVAPKEDVAGIMSRLRDLEEQQQNMQSQFNNNRWGP